MDDDIDIEEHDLMDNPKIKSIFPDLSKLKKEILDPYYEETKESELSKAKDNSSSTSTNTSKLSAPKKITEYKQVNMYNSDVTTFNEIIDVESDNHILPTTTLHFTPKIILGSKKSKENKAIINKQLKIVLRNIHGNLEKSKRFCNTCLILFPSKKTLEEHLKINCSIHLKKKYNYTNKNKVMQNNALNVMVNINNNKIQNEGKNSLRGCFHCNLIFTSQKSLIDHLYEVLGRNDIESKNVAPEITTESNISILKGSKNCYEIQNNTSNIIEYKETSDSQIIIVYQCKICSYYFNLEKFYKIHILNKHKIKELACVDKVRFDPKCKFCFREYNNVKMYNGHLLKSHRDIVLKTLTDTSENNGSQIEVLGTILKDKSTARPLSDSINKTLILSSVIFKCLKCYIHFLSSSVAINHEEHNQMLINWKCTICQKFFKRNDEEFHTRQHRYASSFTVYELCDTDFDKVLYKCSMCAIHCREEDFPHHITFCKQSQVSSSYCCRCDILIDSKIKECHENNHNCKNMSESDFIFIDSGKQTSRKLKDDKTSDSDENGHSNLPPMPKASKRKKVDSESDSDSKPLSLTAKHSNNKKMNKDLSSSSDSVNSMNVVFETDSDSDFKQDEVESSENNSLSDDTDSDYDGKRSICHSKRSKKSKHKCTNLGKFDTKEISKIFKYKTKNQLQLLNLTYCNFCECFISRTYKLDVHLESRCTQILKRVCTYCGLTITAKCSTSHKAFHKLNPNLMLQDFMFYDMTTNEVMCPPIPKFPKCDCCDKYFTSKVEIISHVCIEDDFIHCNMCNIKLSDKAFKLHQNFHNYTLKDINNSVSGQNNEDNSTQISNACEPSSSNNCESIELNVTSSVEDKKESKYDYGPKVSLHVIFTCKVCDISVDEYDMLVNHCQSHYDSKDIIVNTDKCEVCNLKIEASSFKSHQNLHLESNTKGTFKIIMVDVFCFGKNNEEWMNHVFGTLPPQVKMDILEKSIYKFESRIKMEIKQNGPCDLTMYHCEQCRCFIDNVSLFRHVESCSGSKCRKYPCKLCGVIFLSGLSKSEHEQNFHKRPGIALKSYRIVSFNKNEDKILNDAIASTYNRYILYKCRNCGGVVDKKPCHQCSLSSLKNCVDCGLLFNEEEYDRHSKKHKLLESFVEKNMKVILFGSKIEGFQRNNSVCSFRGIVYDYTFFECVKCEVCERYLRRSSKHFCLIDAAKLKCPKCKLVFDEGKMKGHLKLHNSDPDFSRENMLVIPFNPEHYDYDADGKDRDLKLSTSHVRNDAKVNIVDEDSIQLSSSEKTETIYKCACGLHHLTKWSMNDHVRKNCNAKKTPTRQTCAKCGLIFTPNVLFKHLLKHHGDKNVHYKLEVVEM